MHWRGLKLVPRSWFLLTTDNRHREMTKATKILLWHCGIQEVNFSARGQIHLIRSNEDKLSQKCWQTPYQPPIFDKLCIFSETFMITVTFSVSLKLSACMYKFQSEKYQTQAQLSHLITSMTYKSVVGLTFVHWPYKDLALTCHMRRSGSIYYQRHRIGNRPGC